MDGGEFTTFRRFFVGRNGALEDTIKSVVSSTSQKLKLLYINSYGQVVAATGEENYVLATKGDLSSHIKSGSLTTPAEGQITVTFNTPFVNTPHVAIAPYGEATDVIIGVKITSVSKTGFKITTLRSQSGSNSITPGAYTVQWIATDLGNN